MSSLVAGAWLTAACGLGSCAGSSPTPSAATRTDAQDHRPTLADPGPVRVSNSVAASGVVADARRPRTEPAAGDDESSDPSLTRGLTAGYSRLRDSLRSTTRVPILVPSRVLGDANDDSVYVLLPLADSVSYYLIFTPDAECQGGSQCRFGSFQGEVRPQPARPLQGRPVKLSDGTAAVYLPGKCAAGCSDAELVWASGPYLYTAGIKRGRLDQLLAMAASVRPLR